MCHLASHRFFRKTTWLPVNECNDVLEIKLSKGWSRFFSHAATLAILCTQEPVHACIKIRNCLLSQAASMKIAKGQVSVDILFDLLNNELKLIHGLVRTDIRPNDKQNFSSCVKIYSDRVLSALEGISDSCTAQVYITTITWYYGGPH